MNYIITKNREYFKKIGSFNYCELKDMILPNKIAYDSETTGLDALSEQLFCIQIGTGKNNYLIDLQDYSTPLYKKQKIEAEEVFELIKNKTLVGHNIGFDLGFMYMKSFFPDSIRDTMIGSMILHNGEKELDSENKYSPIKHGFGFVMERELGLTYDKSEQKNIHKIKLSTKKSIEYCFNDVDKLLELSENLEKKLEEYGSTQSYLLNCNYIKALTYMELCGLPIDGKKWLEKIEYDKNKVKELSSQIIEYIFDNLPQFRKRQLSLFDTHKEISVSLTSSQQMIPVFNAFGINTIDDEGKESISEDVINKSPHEFVELWLKFQEYNHRVTTFGEKIYNKIKGERIYTRFNPIVDTCRISSRKGEINFLNFPSDKNTRDCFRATKGNKIIVCDFSNQEAVTLADKSKNLTTLKSITEGADTHCMLAREVFPELKNLSDDEIKKNHKQKRQIGKIANFTFAFGGTGYTAAKNLNISIEEGDKIYSAYRALNKETFEWGETILKEALKTGYIESADGFKLKLPFFKEYLKNEEKIKQFTSEDWDMYKIGKSINALEEPKELTEHEKNCLEFYLKAKPIVSSSRKRHSLYMRLCLNNPIQATAAHQTKKSVVNLFEYIKSRNHLRKARIVNVVHDEIIMEVKEELVEEYREKLGEIMRDSANSYLTSGLVKMEADANVGESWYEAK